MVNKTHQPSPTLEIHPLESECRTTLPTREAAIHLNRREQTLRMWATFESGPVRPIRINGRLAWPTAEIKKLMGVAK